MAMPPSVGGEAIVFTGHPSGPLLTIVHQLVPILHDAISLYLVE